MKTDLSGAIASEMQRVLNSDEHKEMYSSSHALEKLAFKRVSEEEKPTEIEIEFEQVVEPKVQEKIAVKNNDKGTDMSDNRVEVKAGFADVLNSLLVVSEDLENLGFEKLAATAILLADRLVVEAKAKKDKASSKSDKKSVSDKKSKDPKSDKSKSKKMDPKERMKKLRDLKKSKTKKTAQMASADPSREVFDKMQAALPPEVKNNIGWRTFRAKHDGENLFVTGEFKVKQTGHAALQAVVGKLSLPQYLGNMIKTVDPRVKETNIIESI